MTLQLPAELQLKGEGRNLPTMAAPSSDSLVKTLWANAFLTQTVESSLPCLRQNEEEGDEDFVFVNLSLPQQSTVATPSGTLLKQLLEVVTT